MMRWYGCEFAWRIPGVAEAIRCLSCATKKRPCDICTNSRIGPRGAPKTTSTRASEMRRSLRAGRRFLANHFQTLSLGDNTRVGAERACEELAKVAEVGSDGDYVVLVADEGSGLIWPR